MTVTPDDPLAQTPTPEAENPNPAASVEGTLERAANGRARCRACGQTLAKGEWRLGERSNNPFGEGQTTYWFHVACGALRRPAVFMAALEGLEAQPELEPWREVAGFGSEHYRVARLAAVGVAPSGRARCRHCRELIEKGNVRIELSIFHDGRFDPMGYLHPQCLTTYVGARVPFERLAAACATLSEPETAIVEQACATEPADTGRRDED